jgi:hypothetical protein
MNLEVSTLFGFLAIKKKKKSKLKSINSNSYICTKNASLIIYQDYEIKNQGIEEMKMRHNIGAHMLL